MNTPICDFVEEYARSGALRMHMPGHKGRSEVGSTLPIEAYDITEIHGADELFHAEGIIAESEKNASRVFGCDTYYSTEGSSLSIRAMLYLCCTRSIAKSTGDESSRPWVLAARNVHQTFVSAAALLDLDVTWMFPENASLISMDLSGKMVREKLFEAKNEGRDLPCCVYITSPDYLGHILPVSEIAEACHEFDVPLVVDNAHGAYLKFLPTSLHPVDLGADLCCDSAHKTLAVLTGGAYLHVSPAASEKYAFTNEKVKQAMVLFASTSPSWLILQSLDRINPVLENEYSEKLAKICADVSDLKALLQERGFVLFGEEPLKITVLPKSYGYTGTEFAEALREKKNGRAVEVEFADADSVVLMVSVSHTKEDLDALSESLLSIPKKEAIVTEDVPAFTHIPTQAMRIRNACFLPSETIPLEEAEGRIAHMVSTSCPPAVPVVICGEKIEAEEISRLYFYGYKFVQVVRD